MRGPVGRNAGGNAQRTVGNDPGVDESGIGGKMRAPSPGGSEERRGGTGSAASGRESGEAESSLQGVDENEIRCMMCGSLGRNVRGREGPAGRSSQKIFESVRR
jgi:hypothetical protein